LLYAALLREIDRQFRALRDVGGEFRRAVIVLVSDILIESKKKIDFF